MTKSIEHIEQKAGNWKTNENQMKKTMKIEMTMIDNEMNMK